ncbi:MAG: histidinol-phosphate phosphatase family protein [Osedax symbiont Rs2]|nr:MAG: histidinol-phosphate phosphatase family protein [Osedax symbiont Rs2]
MSIKLVILDRDGVINFDSDNYIRTLQQWQAIPGSIQAIADLSVAGYKIAVATNQSGIARGYYDLKTLEAMHQKMIELVESKGGKIDKIVFCPHLDEDRCACRKPKPGMLEQILEQFSVAHSDACFVGDSLRDLQAAWAIDMPTALVKTGKGQRTLVNTVLPASTLIFEDLADFSRYLLNADG